MKGRGFLNINSGFLSPRSLHFPFQAYSLKIPLRLSPSLSKVLLPQFNFFKDIINGLSSIYFCSCYKYCQGSTYPDTPIAIQANNVAYSNTIPPQHQNSSIEHFVEYLKCFPLRYALSDIPNPFFSKQVHDLYYSCSFDANAQTIFGTIGYGHSRVNMSPTLIQ